jgi:hypothetical protein
MGTPDRTVRTEHAAISRPWPKFSITTLALIEELADVMRHHLVFNVAAFRTSNGRCQDNILHCLTLAPYQSVSKPEVAIPLQGGTIVISQQGVLPDIVPRLGFTLTTERPLHGCGFY